MSDVAREIIASKTFLRYPVLRDWSLSTGRGGATKWEGGHVKFYSTERGAEKVLAMLKGGHNKFWGSFYAVA